MTSSNSVFLLPPPPPPRPSTHSHRSPNVERKTNTKKKEYYVKTLSNNSIYIPFRYVLPLIESGLMDTFTEIIENVNREEKKVKQRAKDEAKLSRLYDKYSIESDNNKKKRSTVDDDDDGDDDDDDDGDDHADDDTEGEGEGDRDREAEQISRDDDTASQRKKLKMKHIRGSDTLTQTKQGKYQFCKSHRNRINPHRLYQFSLG